MGAGVWGGSATSHGGSAASRRSRYQPGISREGLRGPGTAPPRRPSACRGLPCCGLGAGGAENVPHLVPVTPRGSSGGRGGTGGPARPGGACGAPPGHWPPGWVSGASGGAVAGGGERGVGQVAAPEPGGRGAGFTPWSYVEAPVVLPYDRSGLGASW